MTPARPLFSTNGEAERRPCFPAQSPCYTHRRLSPAAHFSAVGRTERGFLILATCQKPQRTARACLAVVHQWRGSTVA
ncbi:hypothetical protein RRG08_048654 [Elysia crispata]|uniref:Uncharacterized protein n=1 Tax=Elysia crispata TaxID=231223 RepID=A0AAE1DX20_9GAST|nr:hypothetical protein RRG08_048654 [Elysia crispata]